jgi:hypothetical protein
VVGCTGGWGLCLCLGGCGMIGSRGTDRSVLSTILRLKGPVALCVPAGASRFLLPLKGFCFLLSWGFCFLGILNAGGGTACSLSAGSWRPPSKAPRLERSSPQQKQQPQCLPCILAAWALGGGALGGGALGGRNVNREHYVPPRASLPLAPPLGR